MLAAAIGFLFLRERAKGAEVRTVFAGGRVFDGTGAAVAEADVAVADGQIVEVGVGLDGDEQVDVGGSTILPGLFDTHVHVMFGHVDIWRLMQEPFSYRFYDAIRNLEATLRIGITTVRDAGGADLGVKKALEEGIVSGPRVQISITMLSQTGGHGDGWLPSGDEVHLFADYPGSPNGIVDGPDEIRRKVRELVRSGAEVIKIATSGGVLSPRDKPQQPGFDVEEIEAIVAEAHAAGLWVMSHAQSTVGIKSAVRAGVRSIEHGIYLDDEAIQLMLDNGAYLVPTLVAPLGVIKAAEAGAGIPEVAVIKAREVVEAHRDSFRRAVEAGVKVAMGTDAGVIPHGDNLEELQLMAEHGGMSPEDVLVATTRTAAELMGMSGELGTIEPGKRADLVVVSGDPFDFGDLATRIERVYQDGRLVAGAAPEPVAAAV
jgi:imidazolonepropionase-like amidohydrolase